MSLVRFRPEAPFFTGRSWNRSDSVPTVGTMVPNWEPRCGCSSSGRAPPCQGGGSGFEPRHPLQTDKERALRSLFHTVPWPSGKARVCKTLIRQFKSGRYLQTKGHPLGCPFCLEKSNRPDLKDQMQMSGGHLLEPGWTGSTP